MRGFIGSPQRRGRTCLQKRKLAGAFVVGGFLRHRRVAIPLAICLVVWLGLTADLVRGPRLVSYGALPPEDGPECDPPLPAAGLSLVAGELPLRDLLLRDRLLQARIAGGTASETNDASQRKPERMIRDPYAAYSAVAVDAAHDEVVLTDENLFNIWIYDRGAKTPPNERTELKRIIGGPHGVLRMPRGIALDVKNRNMLVSDKRLNAVLTFHFPEIF